MNVSTILDRVADAGGILYVVLGFSGYALLVAPHLPGSLDDPDAVLAFLRSSPPTAAFWAGLWLEGAGLAALVLFAARMAARLQQARPGWWLASSVAGLAVAAFAVKVGSFAPAVAALGTDRLDAGTATALLAVNDAATGLTAALDGAFVLLLGLGALVTRTLPRWLSGSTVAAGTAMLLATAVPALALLELLFLIWVLAASGWLLARGSRTGQPAPGGAPLPS
ncbi:MAG: DUF4386 family protein [Actinomycetes bacterium]